MSESTSKSVIRAQVKNPYLKTSKTTAPSTIARAVEQKDSVAKVTPETGLEKFFVPKQKDNNKKKDVIRKLVPPDGMSSDDDSSSSNNSSSSLYYHSNDESLKSSKKLDQDHMYKSLDYRHRGELQLDQGSLKAYRFIRNHFLIPNDIENNEKFGPHSGQCFEQRVIRTYTLGQLNAKKEYRGESLLVCSYCGDEGHKRDDCLKLL